MDQLEALTKAANDLYVPAFIKACAAYNIPINSEDDLRNAMETVAVIKSKQASESSGVLKEAHDRLYAATTPVQEAPPVQTKLDPSLAEALDVLRSAGK